MTGFPQDTNDGVDRERLSPDGWRSLQGTTEVDSDAFGGDPPVKAGCCLIWEASVPRWGRIASLVTLILWLCVTPLFLILAPKFSKATTSDFDAPSGSPSAKAIDVQNSFFSATVDKGVLVYLIEDQSDDPKSLIAEQDCDKNPTCKLSKHIKEVVTNPTTMGMFPKLGIQGADGYFLGSVGKSNYVGGGNTSTVISITVANGGDDSMNDFIDHLHDEIPDKMPEDPDRYFIGLTGEKVLNKDAGEGTMTSTEGVEKITFPIAFFVLACFIRSGRLMIIPVLTICFCLGTTFAICYGVAQKLSVVTISPALMMAATLAFNVDYNLFLLTRFRENRTPVRVRVPSVVAAGFRFKEGTTVLSKVVKGSDLAAKGVRKGYTLLSVNGEAVTDSRRMRELLDEAVTVGSTTVTEWRMSLWANVWGSVLVHTASETVALSGTLVTIAFVAMALIPLDALYGLGVCGGVSVFVCVVVNCTLSPALLLLFGNFFMGPICCCGTTLDEKIDNACPCEKREEDEDEEAMVEEGHKLIPHDPVEEMRKSCWYRLAELLTCHPWVWVIVVLAVGAPLWIRFPDNLDSTRINADPLEFAPRDSESVHAWRRMGKHFDQGRFQPYEFLLVNASVPVTTDGEGPLSYNSSGIFSPEGYAKLYDMVQTVSNGSGIPMRTFFGPVSFPIPAPKIMCGISPAIVCGADYTAINFGAVEEQNRDRDFFLITSILTDCVGTCDKLLPTYNCSDLCDSAAEVRTTYINALKNQISQGHHKAAVMHCYTPFQPTGLAAMEWMDRLYPVMNAWDDANQDVNAHLAGGNAKFYDFNKKVNQDMPRMIAILLSIVFVIVCIVFKSVAIGLIMGITIAYSVGTAFGLAYYIYQTDAFHWLFTYLPDYNNQGLNWSTVPMCFAITVALAMDYDVFILTRIYELRRRDMTTVDAVKEAMFGVSGTIAGAGCIMAIAFGGLMLTSVVTLNQFGVLLTVSILIDTFLMTTIVVPASMIFLHRHSWFPGPLWAGEKGLTEAEPAYMIEE
eukprot:Hpha_TRINITY_DN16239_c0_g2::TRINITY_DN16239_c0_g2_i1::g.14559::m.14559